MILKKYGALIIPTDPFINDLLYGSNLGCKYFAYEWAKIFQCTFPDVSPSCRAFALVNIVADIIYFCQQQSRVSTSDV